MRNRTLTRMDREARKAAFIEAITRATAEKNFFEAREITSRAFTQSFIGRYEFEKIRANIFTAETEAKRGTRSENDGCPNCTTFGAWMNEEFRCIHCGYTPDVNLYVDGSFRIIG